MFVSVGYFAALLNASETSLAPLTMSTNSWYLVMLLTVVDPVTLEPRLDGLDPLYKLDG